jgi:hypothetical protein
MPVLWDISVLAGICQCDLEKIPSYNNTVISASTLHIRDMLI